MFGLPARGVPVLAGGGRLERATCRGVSLRHQAPKPRSGKTGAAIPRGESGLCDPRRPTPPPAHRCAWHVPPKRIPTRRGGERSEGTSRDGFPDRGSRPSTASAGATRVPAARSPPSPIVITSLSGFRETPARFRASVPAAAGSCRSCPPRLQPGGLQCVANSGETPDDDRCAHHGPSGKTPAGPREQQDPVGTRRALYLAGTMPWDLMTSIAAGLLRTFRSSFAASIDLDSALMPAVNVM